MAARTLLEIDAALDDATKIIDRQAKEIEALSKDARALKDDMKALRKEIRRSERLNVRITEEEEKRGDHSRVHRVLVNGKVVVRAKKPG